MTLLNKVTTNTIHFPQFIQFQLDRADASGTEILILLLYLAVQLDLPTVTDWNRRGWIEDICNVMLRRFISIMSQSIPTGYMPPPPGNPGEIFFERANPGNPGKFFCLIPCPGAKNYCRIPRGGGGKIFP